MNEDYMKYIRETLKDNVDVKYRTLKCYQGNITMIFIDNLCDSKLISEYIAAPIVNTARKDLSAEVIKKQVLEINIVDDVKNKDDAILHILLGDTVLISDFFKEVIFCETKGYVRRSVAIPITENVIRGPREGFTEAFVDNISLIRRKVRNANLKFESVFSGEESNTIVIISYIKGTAPQALVDYVKERINAADPKFILDSSYIEEKLKYKKTVFDTVGYSEKPDIVSSKLLEGRIAIIIDGSPFVVTVPYFFVENFQMPDDYYLNKWVVNTKRVLREIAFLISVFLPAMYIAIITYHFSIIPSVFVFRLAVSRAGVPFPTVVEVILMLFFFQLLREAGIRLPQPVGQAMSIVGALILGDAAVGAGFTSQITIIVVALSSISSFLVPKLDGAMVVWSIIMILFSSFLGLPGFYTGFFVMLSHIAGLRSCEYPYLYPLGTLKSLKFKDLLVRGDLDEISNNIFNKDDKL